MPVISGYTTQMAWAKLHPFYVIERPGY